eukprot:m.244180 g.244180  ORF g.244180 m.244180 type:complete len:133 (-) comp15352_c2_seq1:697-1095(-)
MLATVVLVMLSVSLCINILVLLAVCGGLLARSARMDVVYGEVTPARGILLAVYLSILLVSIALLCAVHITATQDPAMYMTLGLLAVQIIYKVIAPFTTQGGIPPKLPVNPVILSNVGIAIVHTATVAITFAY